MKKIFLPFLVGMAMFSFGCGHTDSTPAPETVDTPIAKPAVSAHPSAETMISYKETNPPPKPARKKKDTTAGALPYESKFNQNFDRQGNELYK